MRHEVAINELESRNPQLSFTTLSSIAVVFGIVIGHHPVYPEKKMCQVIFCVRRVGGLLVVYPQPYREKFHR
jgi:hypothetical protein